MHACITSINFSNEMKKLILKNPHFKVFAYLAV